MKKRILSIAVIALTLSLASCGGKKSAASVAQKWCELNGKVAKASDADKPAAEAARKKYEDEMEAKYKKDEAFMKEVGVEVEKCEDASEGRK